MGLITSAAGVEVCTGIGGGGVAAAIGPAIGGVGGGATGAVTFGAGIGGAGVGFAISGFDSTTGLRMNGSSHVGQGMVWPVPSAGYSMAWPQCGHSDFRNSPIRLTNVILKHHF
jgi:hypothetical protein